VSKGKENAINNIPFSFSLSCEDHSFNSIVVHARDGEEDLLGFSVPNKEIRDVVSRTTQSPLPTIGLESSSPSQCRKLNQRERTTAWGGYSAMAIPFKFLSSLSLNRTQSGNSEHVSYRYRSELRDIREEVMMRCY
jgi:hypothetical protein